MRGHKNRIRCCEGEVVSFLVYIYEQIEFSSYRSQQELSFSEHKSDNHCIFRDKTMSATLTPKSSTE